LKGQDHKEVALVYIKVKKNKKLNFSGRNMLSCLAGRNLVTRHTPQQKMIVNPRVLVVN